MGDCVIGIDAGAKAALFDLQGQDKATGTGACNSLSDAIDGMAGTARPHEVNAQRGVVHLARYPRVRALRDAMAHATLATTPEVAPVMAEVAHA